MLVMPTAVIPDQYGDFTYSSDGTNATITEYTGSGGAVVIPDTTEGLPVTNIGDTAFGAPFNLSDRNDARLLVAGSVGCVAVVGFVCAEALKKGTTK